MKLLVGFDAFGCAEIQLGAAVGAIDQTGEQACSAGCRIPAAVTAQLLHPFKGVYVNNSFLGIRDDLPLLLGVFHLFLDLETDEGSFEIDGTAGVSPPAHDRTGTDP